MDDERGLSEAAGHKVLLTAFALLMFAANSVLCRMALGAGAVDAASFSFIRLASGAAMLLLIVLFRDRGRLERGGDWRSAFWLFLYAVPFSFAYLGITAGTGALILFGSVQLTMLLSAWRSGERPAALQWTGLLIALAGLVYLVSPGLSAPPVSSAGLMALAGAAWGIYSLRGRNGGDPLLRTTGNFLRALPLVIVVSAMALSQAHITATGAVLAAVSGALSSALGYVAWYAALKHLTATKASTLQLSVPVIAALGGAALLSESLTLRLVLASALVLGGVGLTLIKQQRS
jgi:drug/metabolite transporter (DMT)-like permease